ncbi:MAG: hypothetical protein ACW96U_14435, partial [Candidatus Heimdallarchaeaceae archaeon]
PIIDIDNIGLTYENTKNIEHLSITRLQQETLETNMFEHCSKLKYVTIMDTNIEHLELEFLREKKIKKLFIHANRINEIDLTPLEKMYELENLDLSCNNFKKLELEPLKNLRRVKKFSIGGNLLTEIDLSSIQNIPIQIIGLTTFASEMKFDLEKLYEMKKLKYIRYSNPSFNGEEVKPLIEQKKPVTYIKKEHLFIPYYKECNYRCQEVEIKNLIHEIWNEKEYDEEDNPMIYVKNEIYRIDENIQ